MSQAALKLDSTDRLKAHCTAKHHRCAAEILEDPMLSVLFTIATLTGTASADGACCPDTDSVCYVTNADVCARGGGYYYGEDTACDEAFIECEHSTADTDADGGEPDVDHDADVDGGEPDVDTDADADADGGEPEDGACCLDGTCTVMAYDPCKSALGTWYGPGSDCADPWIECETTETGACCASDGYCYEWDSATCETDGGYFYGAGSACTDAFVECEEPPPETGACCVDDTCFDWSLVDCHAASGAWYGLGVPCSDPMVECADDPGDDPADDPGDDPVDDTGACCIDDTCYDITIETCEEKAGVWFGVGIDCSDPTVECETSDPNDGACCLDGECIETNAKDCWEDEGAFYGPGTDCDDSFVECCDDDDDDGDHDVGPVDEEPSKGCSTAYASLQGMVPVMALAGVALITTRRRED